MSDAEHEEPQPEEAAEPAAEEPPQPDEVPDDWLDQKPFDPAGR